MGKRVVKVGIQLPEAERVVRWPELVRMAVRAEELGFDSLWIGDHLLYRAEGQPPRAPWEAWSLLSGLAAVTSKIQLGPLVACTAFHNPAIMAKQASTVEEMSNGRLILGLGSGWNKEEFEAFGVPYDHRVARFEEAFTIIRTLLREGTIDFHGSYYQADDCLLIPRGPRENGPPLMIGSLGERMLKIALPWVDSWNVWFAECANSPEGFAIHNERISALCQAIGRDPSEVERTVAVLVACTGAAGRPSVDPVAKTISGVSSEPELLASTLRGFANAGAQHLQLVLDPITEASIVEVARALPLIEE